MGAQRVEQDPHEQGDEKLSAPPQFCASNSSQQSIAALLASWSRGDNQALQVLTPLVYEELKRLASHYLRQEGQLQTLQTTALVHEAYIRMVDVQIPNFDGRSHFFGIAARLIRQILVDHARKRQTAKRDSGGPLLSFDESIESPGGERNVDLVRLDDALAKLEKMDERQSRIVELRFFGGLSTEEAAVSMGVSPRTVKREWASARAWLFREMSQS
jgi:RNA polymerase sigma factor (TIGR02999 family)